MQLFIFARFHARDGKADAVAAVLREEVPLARAEPGCLAHHAYRSTNDPNLFFIHSRWADDAAFDSHVKLPHTIRFVDRIQPLIDHELVVDRTSLLDSEETDPREFQSY